MRLEFKIDEGVLKNPYPNKVKLSKGITQGNQEVKNDLGKDLVMF